MRLNRLDVPEPVLVAVLAVAAFTIRAWDLEAQSLWFDETYSVFLARLPVADAWAALLADGVHPPLYYALLRGVIGLGQSEAAVRTLSVLAGTLSVVLVYAIGRAWIGRTAAALAGLLLCVSPLQVWYSRDARMYALLMLLSLAAIGTYALLLRRPTSARSTLFVLAHGLAYLTHYFALMVPLVEAIDILARFSRRYHFLRRWTALQALAALPFLGWVVALAGRDAQIFGIGWVPPSAPADLLLTLANFTVGALPPMSVYRWIAFAAFLLLALQGLRARWEDPEAKLLVAVWAFGPPVLTFLLSLRRPVYIDRFLIGSLPAVLLLVAAGLASLRRGWRLLFAFVMAAILVDSMVRMVFVPGQQKEQWREAASELARADPDEVIVVRVLQIAVPLRYYDPGGLPLEALEVNRRVTSLQDLASGHTGVWMVYWNAAADAHRVASSPPFDPDSEREPTARAWLLGQGPRLLEQHDFVGVTILRFEGPG
jgi:uncharacterized membrane protein